MIALLNVWAQSDSALKKRGKEAFTALTAIVYPLPTMMAEIWA
jgi:hypothetical protein